VLSDRTIRTLLERADGRLSIATPSAFPMSDEQFQPASVDLRLADIKGALAVKIPAEDPWVFNIPPGVFALGSTIEWVTLGKQVVGQVHGKSSWARRGLMVECAGLVDPGFSGQLTLELKNLTEKTIRVEQGKRICQLSLDWVDTVPDRVYGDPALRSRYQGQEGPTPAREWAEAGR